MPLIKTLIQWCEINSGSSHLAGLKQMHSRLKQAFLPIADEIQTLSFPPITSLNAQGLRIEQAVGQGLWIQKRPQLKRRVLLCGHMDTVYPEQSPFQKVEMLDAHRMRGPGVTDMKGGLLILLKSLEAFESLPGAQKLGWDVFINADEELGSLASQHTLLEHAKASKVALVFEPSLDAQNILARARKGSGHFTLLAKGIAAHAGRAFESGKNAIVRLAQVITAIDKLNHQRPNLTFNLGLIEGGVALNQVPDRALGQLEVRYSGPKDAKWAESELEKIMRAFPDVDLQGHFHRPCKTINLATEKLFTKTQSLANTLGQTLDWKDTGGCCDGNNLSAANLAVLDTLGARGGNIHTHEEWIDLRSLTERVTLTSALLQYLAEGGLEDIWT